MTRNGPFVSFCPFWSAFWPFRAGYGLSGLCLAFLTLFITWLFAKKMSLVFIHRTVNMVYKRVCRKCPISSCGTKYHVRLPNHLADVHQLDQIQRRSNVKLKSSFAKVKQIIPEKNHSTSIRNPIQTQETVYELSRSRRNEASFKAKAKRPTTKNKTKRKKQRKSNSWLRGHRKIV